MFKFIKSRFAAASPVVETQRQTIDRALSELNEIIGLMYTKPKITMDMQSGSISLDLPEQMPDEALALPAPTAQTGESGHEETTGEDVEKPA